MYAMTIFTDLPLSYLLLLVLQTLLKFFLLLLKLLHLLGHDEVGIQLLKILSQQIFDFQF